MHYEIPGYTHHEGRHCGSGSLANYCRFKGRPLSEPFVVGLGAGLGFGYVSAPIMSPSRVFFTRGSNLESAFCGAVGIGLHEHREKDPAKAWAGVRGAVAAGEPVMINSDIKLLHYFGSKTHFNGHKTLVVGFDDEKQTALISDTEFETLQKEPLETLAEARGSTHSPMMEGGSPWFTFDFPESYGDLTAAVRKAVRLQAHDMLEGKHRLGDNGGTKGMGVAARQMRDWKEAEDWKWCARFGYQIIERRGTGGGAFRKMYAEFLDEASARVPELKSSGLAADMALIAAKWTELAEELRLVSEFESGPDFSKAALIMGELAEREQAFYEKALQTIR